MMDGFNSAMLGQLDAASRAAAGDMALPWLQTPPAQLPWVLPTSQYPDIVQFSAAPGFFQPGFPSPQNAKRKGDWAEEVPCPKKLITEEKISGLLKEMHITPGQQGPAGAEAGECPQQQLKRLVLCEEIRQFKSEPILPSSLLSKLPSPSTSLVLWKPPPGQLGQALREALGAREPPSAPSAPSAPSTSSMDTDPEEEH